MGARASRASQASDLDGLLRLALEASRRAAAEILSVYAGDFAVELKADSTPVTEADRRASQGIEEVLRRGPAYPFLGEEGAEIPYETRRGWRRFWLVDPLDGTKEFVKRNGEFSVNIALIEDGQPLLGVVHAPVADLAYFAHRDLGAWRLEGLSRRDPGAGLQELLAAGARLPRRQSLDLSPGRRYPLLRVMCSRSHRNAQYDAYIQWLREHHAERIELSVLGSALKSCRVAEGQADLYPRFGRTMEWDMAAAHAVVRCVGLRIISIESGAELSYNKPDLGNPSLLVC